MKQKIGLGKHLTKCLNSMDYKGLKHIVLIITAWLSDTQLTAAIKDKTAPRFNNVTSIYTISKSKIIILLRHTVII